MQFTFLEISARMNVWVDVTYKWKRVVYSTHRLIYQCFIVNSTNTIGCRIRSKNKYFSHAHFAPNDSNDTIQTISDKLKTHHQRPPKQSWESKVKASYQCPLKVNLSKSMNWFFFNCGVFNSLFVFNEQQAPTTSKRAIHAFTFEVTSRAPIQNKS